MKKRKEQQLIEDFLDPTSNCWYLLNKCIGAAALVSFDGKKLKLLFSNSHISGDIGVKQTQLMQQNSDNLLETLVPESRPVLLDIIHKAIKKGKSVGTVKTLAGGDWLRITYRHLYTDEDGVSILFNTQERVTKEYELEREVRLLHAEKKLDALIRMDDTVTFEYDIKDDIIVIERGGNVQTPYSRNENFIKNGKAPWWITQEYYEGLLIMFDRLFKNREKDLSPEELYRLLSSGAYDLKLKFSRDQDFKWARALFSVIVSKSGEIETIIGRAVNVDHDKSRETRLELLAKRDSLTGLLNHDAIIDGIDKILKSGSITVFMIDLDEFKSINDTMGHVFGDEVLREAADSLIRIFRSGDIIGRYGGDEFMVCLPGTVSDEKRAERATAVQRAFSGIDAGNGNVLKCSIGIASVNEEFSLDALNLVEMADKALYKAKSSGKNRFEEFGDSEKGNCAGG